jgi:glucosamine--fructose-6-phosphate aminotransferase (isomerizing)
LRLVFIRHSVIHHFFREPSMCGIIGYVGRQQAAPFLLEGLRRLEYRGYDSSGVVGFSPDGELAVTKTAGRVDDLAAKLERRGWLGKLGVGHTRWATHGAATDQNAHPHVGGDGAVALVHNGVIENYQALKDRLEAQGVVFHSATDSEVVAHLIAQELESSGSRPTYGPARNTPRSQTTSATGDC